MLTTPAAARTAFCCSLSAIISCLASLRISVILSSIEMLLLADIFIPLGVVERPFGQRVKYERVPPLLGWPSL